MLKVCSKCRIEQDISEFRKDKSKKDGLCPFCKSCKKIWYETNKNQLNQRRRGRYSSNKKHRESIKIKSREYYYNNKEICLDRVEKYRNENKEKIRETNKKIYYKSKTISVKWDSKLRKNIQVYEDVRKNECMLELKCAYCDIWFKPKYNDVHRKVNVINGLTDKYDCKLYCSEGCKKDCPTFKKQLYEKGYEPVSSREVQSELRKMVLNKDNHTCQKCGKHKNDGVRLHCHHIDPVINNPIESADIDNCITLCIECHTEIHKKVDGCKYNQLKCI